MGIFDKLFEKRSEPSTLSEPRSWLERLLTGTATTSGVRVNEYNALQMTAVWSCVRVISETAAGIPFPVYRRVKPRGKERVSGHHINRLLNVQPNPEMTAMTFREVLTAHALTWGNGYAYVLRDLKGDPLSLWPITPNRVQPIRDMQTKELYYQVQLTTGTRKIPKEDILHIIGLGFDGLTGYSPIRMAQEAIGIGKAADHFAGRFYEQGTHLGGIIEMPGVMGDGTRARLREDLKEKHQGIGKSHLLLFLEEGVKYHKVGIPPNEAQFLETRKWQAEEIARVYRVPPHKIGLLERSTFSNIEQQAIEFATDTMLPWLRRWEQAVNITLFSDSEQDSYFAEHVLEGLLRGDIQSRYNAYAVGRQWGWLSANDVRELENMNPLAGDEGDIYYVPLNMMPTSEARQQDSSPSSSERSHQTTFEKRTNTLASRQRLMGSWRDVMTDAAARAVRRETADIRRAAKSHLGQRSLPDFKKWLEDFYRDAPEWISKTYLPVLQSYARALIADLSDEDVLPDGYDERLENFISEYAKTLGVRQAAQNRRELTQLLDDSVGSEEDPLTVVTSRMDHWEEHQPAQRGLNEVTRVTGAVSRFAYTMAGHTTLRWHANEGACPYCQEMDGKVVGIDDAFVLDGESLDPNGGTGALKIRGSRTHPPLHDGCVCIVLPG